MKTLKFLIVSAIRIPSQLDLSRLTSHRSVHAEFNMVTTVQQSDSAKSQCDPRSTYPIFFERLPPLQSRRLEISLSEIQ